VSNKRYDVRFAIAKSDTYRRPVT